MAKGYLKMVLELVSLLGGAENINFVTHCATRLRVDVKDSKLVHKDKIANLESVANVSQTEDGKCNIVTDQDKLEEVFSELKQTLDRKK
ncbi:PTS transporter subunit EIIB [Frischella perrara]|uniref:PTS transporter subunit EIIB n=1 Tax=Frischella perrara TaxID=1267021 RepID=UPI0023F0F778|nr:PTS transporter subunit EIIB [Frischella perrara]